MTNSFDEYFSQLVAAHGRGAALLAHLVGTSLSILLTAFLLRVGLVYFLPIAALPALQGAVVASWFSDRAAPTTASPLWAAWAEIKLLGLALSGGLRRARERRSTQD